MTTRAFDAFLLSALLGVKPVHAVTGDKERIHEVGPPRRAMQRVVAAVRPSCYRRHGRCLPAIGSQVLHPPDKAEHHVTPGEGPKSGEEYIELFRQQKS